MEVHASKLDKAIWSNDCVSKVDKNDNNDMTYDEENISLQETTDETMENDKDKLANQKISDLEVFS